MKPTKHFFIFALVFLLSFNLISSLSVDADYITIFPGETGKITLEIENNENFDIEDISVRLDLAGKREFNDFGVLVSETPALPFTAIGSSTETIDEIDEDDDDRVSFTLKPFSDITPGDYNIPYTIEFFEKGENDELIKEGSFGIRVSAKTELDFAVEVKDNAIVGEEGSVSLEVINKGLGDLKSVSVTLFPQGFDLISKDKVFIGSVNADDTDIATFDVIYTATNPVLKAEITYKDFDNKDQTESVSLPFKVYTREEALEKGIIKNNRTGLYIGIIVALIIIWVIFRRIRKARRSKKKLEGR